MLNQIRIPCHFNEIQRIVLQEEAGVVENGFTFHGPARDMWFRASGIFYPVSNRGRGFEEPAMFEILRRHPGDADRLAQCRRILRFCEKRFVCWERPANHPNWDVPSVLEQYACFVPIDASAAKMIRAFLAGVCPLSFTPTAAPRCTLSPSNRSSTRHR